MQIQTYKLIPFAKIFLSLALVSMTGVVHAEYYVAYAGAPQIIEVYGYKCYKHKHHSCYKHKKHTVQHKKHRPARVYHHRSPRISVYYIQPVVAAPCGVWVQGRYSCGGEWVPERRRVRYIEDPYVDVMYGVPEYEYVGYSRYNPDLSTGDDNVSVYPGMNIDE